MDTLRVFVKWLESVDAVEQDLHKKVRSPDITPRENSRDVMLETEDAETMLAYLERYEYASIHHVTATLLWHTMLRMGSVRALDVADHLDLDDGVLALSADIQKDYPTDRTPSYTEIELADETVRTLRTYLAGRWKETAALWPSRQSDRLITESVRNVVREAAVGADVRPMTVTGGGDPEDVTPHTLRHSVAYRMLNVEDGRTFYDVRNRLRHATIQTTERVYDHIDRV